MIFYVVNTVCCWVVAASAAYLLARTLRDYPMHYKFPLAALMGIQGLMGIATIGAFFDDASWLELARVPVSMVWSEIALAWVSGSVALGAFGERVRQARKRRRRPLLVVAA